MAETATSMIVMVGTQLLVRFESIDVRCTVTDIKSSYGTLRYQVSPLSGFGSQWIQESRICRISTISKREAV